MGSRFRFQNEDAAFYAKLSEVQSLTSRNRPAHLPRQESFSLLFEPTGTQTNLAQDVYRVEHQSMGRFDCLAVPVLKNGALEIVFG